MKCKCGAFVNVAWTVCLSCKAKIEKPKTAPRIAPNVALQLAVDSESLFMALWRRTANRLKLVMAPGYTGWVQTHAPELWARREVVRETWDTPEAYQAFKECRITWAEYRRRIYAWVRAELEAIRRHRDSLHVVRGQRQPNVEDHHLKWDDPAE